MNPVSAIIPAYNEEKRIASVLSVLRDVPIIETILVVDDGSTDNTSISVASCQKSDTRIQLIRNLVNRGKGQAVLTGWEKIFTPYLLTLDADLQDLTADHIQNLCQPVLDGTADMTLGIFRHGHLATDFSHWAAPWLTGQRCFRTELLACLSMEASRGYGFETALTVLARTLHKKTVRVYLDGVSHPPSELHRGPLSGILNRGRMYLEIMRAWHYASIHRPEIQLNQRNWDLRT